MYFLYKILYFNVQIGEKIENNLIHIAEMKHMFRCTDGWCFNSPDLFPQA